MNKGYTALSDSESVDPVEMTREDMAKLGTAGLEPTEDDIDQLEQNALHQISMHITEVYVDTTSAWDEIGYFDLGVVFKALNQSLTDNIDYFSSLHHQSTLLKTLQQVRTVVYVVEPMALQVARTSINFDFPGVRGNGYRTLVSLVHITLRELLSISDNCVKNREYIWNQKSAVRSQLADFGISILDNLLFRLLESALSLHPPGSSLGLFSSKRTLDEVLSECSKINKEALLGRISGFQFPSDMRQFFKLLSVTKASYGSAFDSRSTLARTVKSAIKASRFYLDSAHRAHHLANHSCHSDVEFMKAFWNLAESTVVRTISNARAPGVAVSIKMDLTVNDLIIRRVGFAPFEFKVRMLTAPPPPPSSTSTTSTSSTATPSATMTKTYSVDDVDGFEMVDESDVQALPQFTKVSVLFLSYHRRIGMEPLLRRISLSGTGKAQPVCRSLIVHFHGGGFIAGSPYSHEFYLRTWSKKLKTPIISVDYSLAPKFPFPTALQECVFTYAWSLANKELLGTTAEFVYFTGDSAGGNFVISTAIRAIQLGLPSPVGLFPFYPALNVESDISPARLVSLCDILLSETVLLNCLKAYKGDQNLQVRNPLISPFYADDDTLRRLPHVHVFACKLDPLLDDSVAFCCRLHHLGCSVKLNLYDHVSHGFLNFKDISKDAGEAFSHSLLAMKEFLDESMKVNESAMNSSTADEELDPSETMGFAIDRSATPPLDHNL